jgi:hypothetical protein
MAVARRAGLELGDTSQCLDLAHPPTVGQEGRRPERESKRAVSVSWKQGGSCFCRHVRRCAGLDGRETRRCTGSSTTSTRRPRARGRSPIQDVDVAQSSPSDGARASIRRDIVFPSAPSIMSQPQAGWALLSEVGGAALRGATAQRALRGGNPASGQRDRRWAERPSVQWESSLANLDTAAPRHRAADQLRSQLGASLCFRCAPRREDDDGGARSRAVPSSAMCSAMCRRILMMTRGSRMKERILICARIDRSADRPHKVDWDRQ